MTPGLKQMSEAQRKYYRDVVQPAESRLQTTTNAENDAAAAVASLEMDLQAARERFAVAQDQRSKAQTDLDRVLPGLETA
jgi:hypothetical protein